MVLCPMSLVFATRLSSVESTFEEEWITGRFILFCFQENRETDLQIKSLQGQRKCCSQETYPGQFCIISGTIIISESIFATLAHFDLRQWKLNIVVRSKRVTANRVI